MTQPFRIAVFASGNGSNFQAIIDAVQAGTCDVTVELLVCDRPQAKVVERAQQAGISTFLFRFKDFATREAAEATILQELKDKQIDLIVLAGYMRIISNTLVAPYYGRMINIHPSLLPTFPGVDGIKQAVDYGVKVTGVTVHYVDGGMDSGPIIAQEVVTVKDDDTEETLAARIHPVEHALFPKVIQWIRENRVHIEGRKVQMNSFSKLNIEESDGDSTPPD